MLLDVYVDIKQNVITQNYILLHLTMCISHSLPDLGLLRVPYIQDCPFISLPI
jgi:hypothetical protein